MSTETTTTTASVPPPGQRAGSVAWAARAFLVRLRFPLLLAGAVAVVAGWETIATWSWRLIDRVVGVPSADAAVSSGTEYFCPMDPGVLSDWPSKCPICNMALVRRQRGDMAPLPEGVLARVQLTPYRVQLAGLATTEVRYRPLVRTLVVPVEVVEPGAETNAPARLSADLFADEALGLEVGARIEIDLAGEPVEAKIVGLEPGSENHVTVRLEALDASRRLRPGSPLRARVSVPVAALPPFRDQPRDAPPLRRGELRSLHRCPDHLEIVREKPGTCPKDRAPLVAVRLADNQRVRWWCPMHPAVTAEAPGARCEACSGMILVPRIVSYAPPGEVLAVPESAVLDTGTRQVVYLERMPGVYDGVEVVLGPRSGDACPVLSGLEPGQRVVSAGAFLVDAETRLNPGLAAAYFGASRPAATGPSAPPPPSAPATRSPAVAAAIARQGTCPVTGMKLGSMGDPPAVVLRGRTVYICCEGCRGKLEAEPEKYLAKLAPRSPQAPASP